MAGNWSRKPGCVLAQRFDPFTFRQFSTKEASMAGYQTTYSAGMSKMESAPGSHDPADETSTPWDPATDPDTGHPSSADKPIEERVDWEVPVPPEDPAQEAPPVEPPVEPVVEGDRL